MEEFWSFELLANGPEDEAGLILARSDLPENLFILNHSAGFLWSLLSQSSPRISPPQLAEALSHHFGIPLSRASADVSATLTGWAKTLLRESQPSEVSSPVDDDFPLPESARPALFIADFSLGEKSFRLSAQDPEFIDEIQPRMAHLTAARSSAPPPSADHTFNVSRSHRDQKLRVFRDATLLTTEAEASCARTTVLQEIARLAYRPSPSWLAVVHAAAVAHPTTNHAVIMPAPTNSGKSTLTAALLHSGLRLLSDDSAAITNANEILPLPFALMLRQGSWPILEPYLPALASTPICHRYGYPVRFMPPPAATTREPAIPKHLVFISHQPNRTPAKLFRINKLQTFLQLQASGFFLPCHSRSSIAAFVDWVQTLSTYQLNFSELPDAVVLLNNLLA